MRMRRRALLSIVPVLIALPALASAQGMDRSGVLDIRSEEERRVFGDLQCTCGCARESIATCTCGIASGFREDVRSMMVRGMTREEIRAEWVRRYGPQALTVPDNVGANRLVYIAPLAAIVGMGAVAVATLRRFRKQAERKPMPAAGAASKKRDEYDDKLDEELRQLDDE
jgi:cytochrome c-type biogenesis protein CcmH/NrfF